MTEQVDNKVRAMILKMYLMGSAPSTIVKRARQEGVLSRVTRVLIKQAHEVLMERVSPENYYQA